MAITDGQALSGDRRVEIRTLVKVIQHRFTDIPLLQMQHEVIDF